MSVVANQVSSQPHLVQPYSSFNRIAPSEFREEVANVIQSNDFFRRNLSLKSSYSGYDCWVDSDKSSGFAVSPDRELVNVFSKRTGRGGQLIKFALENYQQLHLNCFADGYLEQFYQKHGFKVMKRATNWQPGAPDVLYMRHGHPSYS